jgi:hypothetical protein
MSPKFAASALLALSLVAGSGSFAQAKTSRKVSHAYDKVWPASVRFLRIDAGLEIIEKDVDSGYVLFTLEEEGRVFRGAMELIRRKDSRNRDAVELIIDIEDRPSYMEHALLDKMLKKIRLELGLPKDPDSPPAPAPAPKEADEGDEGDGKASAN